MTEMISPLGDEWLTAPASIDGWAEALRHLGSADVDTAGGVARGLWQSRYSPGVALDELVAAYEI